MTARRTWVVLAFAVFAFTPTAASPLATGLGDLTPIGCVANSGGPASCTTSDGLGGAAGAAVSPDGKNVYVAGANSDAIDVFARNTATGALTPTGCLGNPGTGPAACNSADGLDGAAGVAISPDGKNVYVTGSGSNAIVVFARDTATGALTPAGCIGQRAGRGPAACNTDNGLDGAIGVAVSPDGKNVYVTGSFSHAINVYARDTGTGALTPAGCIAQSGIGPETCNAADGLRTAHGVAVSPDGKDVYVTGADSDAIGVFARNTATGALTAAGCIGNSGTGPPTCNSSDGLKGPLFVAVSPDGENVYVTGSSSHAIVVFARDATGALTPTGCIGQTGYGPPSCNSVDGLYEAAGVAVSRDGKSVYVTGNESNTILVFARDTATGALTPIGCIGNPGTGPAACNSADGLGRASGVAVSPDGENVYVTGFSSNAVVVFSRQTTAGAPSPSASGAPVISQAQLAPEAFRAAAQGGVSTVSAGTGTTVSYRDSEASSTSLTVVGRVAGHRSGGRCVAGAPHAGQTRCIRAVTFGSFLHNDTDGANQFHFSGRVASRTLSPGSYQLALTPHANGHTGATVRLSFTITA